MDMDFCQDNVQAHEEIREDSTSSRSHALYAVEDKHEQKRHVAEWDMTRTTKMQKKTDTEGSGICI